MRRHLLPLLLLPLLAARPAAALTFYSIDVTNDQLVTIDSATGAVTTVGAIGYNFVGAQLAWLGGSLYATNLPQCVNSTIDLVKIDPATGAKISQTRVKVGASDLVASAADGLTANATSLLLSYRGSNGQCGQASILADLSTSGAVTGGVDFYPAFGVAADMDNLAFDPSTNRVLGNDGVTGGSNNPMNLYNVSRPSTYTFLGGHTVASNDGYTGMVFTNTGALYMYLRVANQVRRIDPNTGAVLSSVTLTSSRALRGLAFAQAATPVESSTWGHIKAIYR